jgi:hypothetical protein
MGPTAISACGGDDEPVSSVPNPDPGLAYLGEQYGARDSPTVNSCLYYSMIYPLLRLPFSLVFWYQGEADAGSPNMYSRFVVARCGCDGDGRL